jgi:wyosine [tRNA(Phe)-imidazoG37] synthetase (radical SAM superfamily)
MGNNTLNTTNHDRDSANLHYVYPVISRRAGGVSVGINLNPNNACNWRCIYCQVPELTRGTAPPIDLVALEKELLFFLEELLHGEFMQTRVPQEMRRINDIALSGNGEPTSAAEFYKVTEIIARVRNEMRLPEELKTVLITNGSLLFRSTTQQGLRNLAQINGEVWFKLDRASAIGMQRINDTHTNMSKVRDNLVTSITNCPTWLQTCWFAIDAEPPTLQDENEYLEFISSLLNEGYKPQGVLLYSLARPSLQAEAPRLSALSEGHLNAFADRIVQLGLPVKVNQ